MKRLHRRDLYTLSAFQEHLDIDFNSVCWARPSGNVVIDPLALSPHDLDHLRRLGGVEWVVITNSDHLRATEALIAAFGAKVAAPSAERDDFPCRVDRWLADGDALVPGLVAVELQGSKTPGELALILEGDTLICGDLVRAHWAGALMLLPAEKGVKPEVAAPSIERLARMGPFRAVLVGDGWHAFQGAQALLQQLSESLRPR